mmetsp:Transcript_17019/g.25636  ORF Transcript_17019/g.25636 Transcript_17019/m.25636 type:complete len:277 (+) Transcript_17019:93-923(+)
MGRYIVDAEEDSESEDEGNGIGNGIISAEDTSSSRTSTTQQNHNHQMAMAMAMAAYHEEQHHQRESQSSSSSSSSPRKRGFLRHIIIIVILIISQHYLPPPPPPNHSWNEYLSHSSQGFIATILHVTMLTSYIIYGTFEDAYRDGIFYFRDVVYGMSRLQKCHSRTAGRGIDYALDLNEEDRGADEESRETPTNMIHQILNHIHAQDGAGVCSNYNITWRKLIQIRNIRSSASSFLGNQLFPSRRRLWQKGSMDLDGRSIEENYDGCRKIKVCFSS